MFTECLYHVNEMSAPCPQNVRALSVDQSQCMIFPVYTQQLILSVMQNDYVLMQRE